MSSKKTVPEKKKEEVRNKRVKAIKMSREEAVTTFHTLKA